MNKFLLEALATFLVSDPTISTSFQGIYLSTAAPGTDLPYLTLLKSGSTPTGILGKHLWVDKVIINFEARATTGDQAESLTEQVRTALFRKQPTLGWAGGQECGRWLAGDESSELEEGLGPDGTDVWVSRIPIGFSITRSV